MRGSLHRWIWILLFASHGACAQLVVRNDELLTSDRPEAWAMNYMAASTYMTAFGETPVLATGHWNIALELGDIPPLNATQRQVGFNGYKTEDLNKSPVFGRIRLALGLPAGWVAEFGYTPPLAIDGARARNLVGIAFGHRLVSRDSWSLSARAFGQHGSIEGDITCPVELAGIVDPEENPFGCQAASQDEVDLNYYGAELTTGGGGRRWHWHAALGVVRTELTVHVDALTFDVRDRSRLTANGVRRYVAAGVRHDLDSRWSIGAEVLYVPLSVRRDPDMDTDDDPLTSFRLQLRYQPSHGP